MESSVFVGGCGGGTLHFDASLALHSLRVSSAFFVRLRLRSFGVVDVTYLLYESEAVRVHFFLTRRGDCLFLYLFKTRVQCRFPVFTWLPCRRGLCTARF